MHDGVLRSFRWRAYVDYLYDDTLQSFSGCIAFARRILSIAYL